MNTPFRHQEDSQFYPSRHATPLFKDSAKSKTTTASAIMPLGAISISYSSASYTMREISSMREFAFASSRLVSTTMT